VAFPSDAGWYSRGGYLGGCDVIDETEVRALIERLRNQLEFWNSGGRFVAAVEALLAERDADTAINLATVSAYESGVADGAVAERDRAVAFLEQEAAHAATFHSVVPGFLKGAADALARNEHGRRCAHEGYDFAKHGRCCPHCGTILTDFGD
jgi:hypothetical protein